MRIVAALCNIALCVFTILVLLTEGVSKETPYIVLTVLLLLVPVVSAIVLFRGATVPRGEVGDHVPARRRDLAVEATIVVNLVLAGFVGWALVAQYPHPAEEDLIGMVALIIFLILIVATPVLTLAVLLGGVRKRIRERQVHAAPL